METVGDQPGSVSRGDTLLQDGFAARRATLAQFYHSLPLPDSPAFWQALAECQEKGNPVPLEVLVKVLRDAVARGDGQTEERLFETIIARLQPANERWVYQVLASGQFLAGEQRAMAADLYADLCELLLRLLRDPAQRFWEEHFQHSLRFARKHAYEHFLRYEGYGLGRKTDSNRRVPHALLESLERWGHGRESDEAWEVCDERAEDALKAVERGEDVAALVIGLPPRLRTVVWLTFWEDQPVKVVGELLHISDRTVRNHLRAALTMLREAFGTEQGGFDGKSE